MTLIWSFVSNRPCHYHWNCEWADTIKAVGITARRIRYLLRGSKCRIFLEIATLGGSVPCGIGTDSRKRTAGTFFLILRCFPEQLPPSLMNSYNIFLTPSRGVLADEKQVPTRKGSERMEEQVQTSWNLDRSRSQPPFSSALFYILKIIIR